MLIAVLMCAMAWAQNSPPPAAKMGPATLVLPVAGAPLSAEVIEERSMKLADGTSKTEVITSKVFRDAAGRLRTESNQNGANGESKLIVTVMDRSGGFMAVLVPSEKMGGRFQFPKQDTSVRGGFAFFGNPLILVPGKKSFKSESLGKQTIDGIEYEGDRTTTTSDEQPSLVGVEERWMNGELGLIGLTKSSGPNEQSTAKIRSMDRHAPDPALFEIPSDYVIQDLKDDLPPR
jgi:hypothetical protein